MIDPEVPYYVQWLERWDQTHKDGRPDYVAEEVQRLIGLGEPVLLACITAPFCEQIDMALAALRQIRSATTLRLIPGAVTPPIDPHGRPMKADDKHRVLECYLGDLTAPPGSTGKASDDWSALHRMSKYERGGRIYRTQRIEPGKSVSLSTDDAATVLRNWGHSYDSKRWRSHPRASQDTWLVVEDCVAFKDIRYENAPMPAAAGGKPHKAA